MSRVRDIYHKYGAFGAGVQPAPEDTAPHPTLIGISCSPWQHTPAFWAARCRRGRVKVRVRVVSDILGARQGIAVLVFLDEHWQSAEPELLVLCTPDASLPIDVHVGADHPNEQASGTAFAHFGALPSPALPCSARACHSLSPIMVCTLSSVRYFCCHRPIRLSRAGSANRSDIA